MTGFILATLSFFIGGILKGATGAGAPIIAVPVTALFFGVPAAVTIFAVPNLLTNLWQGWKYRAHILPSRFVLLFCGGGALGTLVGTILLVRLSVTWLTLTIAFSVFLYIGFRLLKPNWKLGFAAAMLLALPAGALAGVLYGASALSAPISLSFLNAIKPERNQFIATISCFFASMGMVQIPLLIYFGLMNGEKFLLSSSALIPILAGMPVGAWLARHLSRESFDRIILLLLAIIAIKLLLQAM